MQNALACANRIFDLLEEEEESPDVEGTINEVKGNVSISHVDFSYDKNHRLIEDFNLEVDPGMRIAIVGPTGCGKTTFINLLMRFYDVDQGNIKIDGKYNLTDSAPCTSQFLWNGGYRRLGSKMEQSGKISHLENQMPQMKTLSVRQKKHIAGNYRASSKRIGYSAS